MLHCNHRGAVIKPYTGVTGVCWHKQSVQILPEDEVMNRDSVTSMSGLPIELLQVCLLRFILNWNDQTVVFPPFFIGHFFLFTLFVSNLAFKVQMILFSGSLELLCDRVPSILPVLGRRDVLTFPPSVVAAWFHIILIRSSVDSKKFVVYVLFTNGPPKLKRL